MSGVTFDSDCSSLEMVLVMESQPGVVKPWRELLYRDVCPVCADMEITDGLSPLACSPSGGYAGSFVKQAASSGLLCKFCIVVLQQ